MSFSHLPVKTFSTEIEARFDELQKEMYLLKTQDINRESMIDNINSLLQRIDTLTDSLDTRVNMLWTYNDQNVKRDYSFLTTINSFLGTSYPMAEFDHSDTTKAPKPPSVYKMIDDKVDELSLAIGIHTYQLGLLNEEVSTGNPPTFTPIPVNIINNNKKSAVDRLVAVVPKLISNWGQYINFSPDKPKARTGTQDADVQSTMVILNLLVEQLQKSGCGFFTIYSIEKNAHLFSDLLYKIISDCGGNPKADELMLTNIPEMYNALEEIKAYLKTQLLHVPTSTEEMLLTNVTATPSGDNTDTSLYNADGSLKPPYDKLIDFDKDGQITQADFDQAQALGPEEYNKNIKPQMNIEYVDWLSLYNNWLNVIPASRKKKPS
jgi:hypothetical protein